MIAHIRFAVFILAIISSTTATAQWTRMSGPVPPHSSEIIRHHDALILGTDFADRGDVFISHDQGHSWTDMGLPNGGVASILSHGDRLFVGGYLSGLQYTDDLGVTWHHADVPSPNPTIEALLALDDGTLILGADEFFPAPLYRSVDGGATWAPITPGPSLRCFDLELVDGVVLAAGKDSGVWRSLDDGATWSQTSAGLPNQADTYRFATDGSTIYVAAWRISTAPLGVYRSDDLGATWTQVNQDPITTAWQAAHLSYQDGVLYLGAEGTAGTRGIYRSLDQGVTWSLITADLPGFDPSGMAAIVADGELLVGTLSGVFRSDDGGGTWTESWQGSAGVYSGDAMLFLDGRLHGSYQVNGGGSQGLAVTSDMGGTWEFIETPGNSQRPIDFLLHGDAVLAAFYGFPRGVGISSDGGDSYVMSSEGMDPGASLRCLIEHDGALYAGSWEAYYRSDDDGATWIADPQLGTVNTMISHGGHLWAGLQPGGVVRSADGGATWNELSEGLSPTNTVEKLVVHDGVVWAVPNIGPIYRWDGSGWVDGGTVNSQDLLSLGDLLISGSWTGIVEYTADGGVTWHDFSEGFSDSYVESLIATDSHLVMGVRGSGYWSRPLSDLPVTTGVDQTPSAAAMTLQIAPNPFNPQTTVRFELPSSGQVIVDVFDTAGRRVRRLVDGHRESGPHAFTWNGRDDRGRGLASGVYLVRASAGSHSATSRAVLVR